MTQRVPVPMRRPPVRAPAAPMLPEPAAQPPGRRQVLALLAASLTGCIPASNAYVLTPVPGTALTGTPMTVSVRGVALPQWLQRGDVVRATDVPLPDEVPSAWWAEPLDVMIGRVATQDLIQRMPGSYVFFDPRPPFTPADVWVELTFSRFDTNRDGIVLVQGSVGVIGLRFLTRTVWKTVTPADDSTQALVTALSIALGRFCDLIAAVIVESRQQAFH